MDPKKTLVDATGVCGEGMEGRAVAMILLADYKTWRDKGGYEPIMNICGTDYGGDLVFQAVYDSVSDKTGFHGVLAKLKIACQGVPPQEKGSVAG